MGYRIVYFFTLIIVGVFITPLLSLPLALFYALRWYATELVVIGYVFDVYFGQTMAWPYYTLSLAGLVLICELAKRYLLFKNESD